MATSFSSAQLERFRREAKKLSRELSITHSAALDRIAARHGFANWSLLSKHSEATPASSAVWVRPKARSSGLKRYYLHGDQTEDDPTQYYCARCDVFVEAAHFGDRAIHDDKGHLERILASLERWNRRSAESKARWRRPDDAPNVLVGRALAERAAYEASRGPFHRWLTTQKDRDDPVGDLAVDALRDKTFPVHATTRREVEAYLSRHGDHVVRSVRQAWREFAAAQTAA